MKVTEQVRLVVEKDFEVPHGMYMKTSDLVLKECETCGAYFDPDSFAHDDWHTEQARRSAGATDE